MTNRFAQVLVLGIAAATPAAAQIGVPQVGDVRSTIGGVLDRTGRSLEPLGSTLADLSRSAAELADRRVARLTRLVRSNRETMELDASGNPARRGELLLTEAGEEDVARAQAAGFSVLERETLGTLGISVVRLAPPTNVPLAKAEAALRKLLPGAAISADTLHFPSGSLAPGGSGLGPASKGGIATTVGVIDGAPGPAIPVSALHGFARGAPRPSHHGSAIASLLRTAGVRQIAVADVYGNDPAGGNALAIARGLDWLAARDCRVVTISLVGPTSPLLARAVAAAQRRGMHIVAAVGNDGPAAPPSFPASYPGVLAVTGVDGRRRALIEAGRASHVDYAAPAADMLAADADGRWRPVRGTSYAAPLVAARTAAAMAGGAVIPTLDREAVDLGRKGADPTFGRGLLCPSCGRRK